MAVEAMYFSHDHGSRNDPKLIKVRRKHGMAGIGVFWCIIEMLNEEGGTIMLSECERIAYELQADDSVVASMINDFDLFKNNGEVFWSESSLRRIGKRLDKSKKASESAKKRWKDAMAMRTHSDGNAIKEIKERIEIKGEEITPAPEIISPGFYEPTPTLEEVKGAFKMQGEQNDKLATDFWEHYETVGWKIAGQPMTKWKAKIGKWQRGEITRASQKKTNTESHSNSSKNEW